jgi:hypothetical protein
LAAERNCLHTVSLRSSSTAPARLHAGWATIAAGGGANVPESRWRYTGATGKGRTIGLETAQCDNGTHFVPTVLVAAFAGNEVVIDEMLCLARTHVDEREVATIATLEAGE